MTEHAATAALEGPQRLLHNAHAAHSKENGKNSGLAYEMIEPTCLGDAGSECALLMRKVGHMDDETDLPCSAETSTVSESNDDFEGRDGWSVRTIAELPRKAAEFAEAHAQLPWKN